MSSRLASSSGHCLGLAVAARMRLALGDQGQELLSLELALDLLGEEDVEELQGDRAEFAEAFA